MFRSATLKLTVYYTLIVMAISLIFSIVLYRFATEALAQGLLHQFNRWSRIYSEFEDQNEPPMPAYSEELTPGTHHILLQLVYFNCVVLVGAGAASYTIERSLEHLPEVRKTLEEVSGRQLDEHWSPIQIMEGKYLKKRKFINLDKEAKTLSYEDADGNEQIVSYQDGSVKLDWRLDWPGRWWLQNVAAEPSGRDHSTKGGSVDTGEQIIRNVFNAEPPLAIAYDFINMVGDTKKMSASKGTGLSAVEGSKIMPPEVVRYFIMRSAPGKRLYFDPVNGVMQLMDEFAAFAARTDRSEAEEQLLYLCTRGIERKTVSRVPFSLLVASYQAALRDADRTIATIGRTEYADIVVADSEIIKAELHFIDAWLEKRAPEDVKFALRETVEANEFSEQEQQFLRTLGDKVAAAPTEADGAWFHNAIYELRDSSGLQPKELFGTLYRAIIGKSSGPRAGWFLSILPRDWLVARLRLEK